MLPSLQAVLAQNGATILENGGLYRVAPAAGCGGVAGVGHRRRGGKRGDPAALRLGGRSGQGAAAVCGGDRRVSPDPGRNALLLSGDPATREALLNLVHAFDIDALAGQSYALFPVSSGGAGILPRR